MLPTQLLPSFPGIPIPGVDLFANKKKDDKTLEELQKPQLEASLLSKQDAVNHLLFNFNKKLLTIDKNDSHGITNFFLSQRNTAAELINGLVEQLSDDRSPNNQEEERLHNLFKTSFKRIIRRLAPNDTDVICRELCKQIERELLSKQNYEYLEYYMAKKKTYFDLLRTIVEEKDDFQSLTFFMQRNYNNLPYWDYLFKYVSKRNEVNDTKADELTFKSAKTKSPIPEDDLKDTKSPDPDQIPPKDIKSETPAATPGADSAKESKDQAPDSTKTPADDGAQSASTPAPAVENTEKKDAPKEGASTTTTTTKKKKVTTKKKKASTASSERKSARITFKLEKDITKGKIVCLMCACFGTYNAISLLLTKFSEYFKTEEDQFTLADATKLCTYSDFELNELEKKKWILDSLNSEITAPKNKIETMEEKITQTFTSTKNPKAFFEQNQSVDSNDPSGGLLQQLYPPKVFSLENNECLECGLPFDNAEKVVVFPCGHGFHSNCCSLEICHLCYSNQFHSLLD